MVPQSWRVGRSLPNDRGHEGPCTHGAGRGMRPKDRAQTEEGLFGQAKEFEFYPEGHSGPWGFLSKCVVFKGKAYCLLPFHSQKGKAEKSHFLHLSLQVRGWSIFQVKSREEHNYMWLQQIHHRLHFHASDTAALNPGVTAGALGHPAGTLAWNLETESERQPASAMCTESNSSRAAQTKILPPLMCP